MDTTERHAWLHQCGHLVPGADTTYCPGCRCAVRRPSEVEARYILTPVGEHGQDIDGQCGAAAEGFGGRGLGPCVLPRGHADAVHREAGGAQWWPSQGGVIAFPEPMTAEQVEAFRAEWEKHHGWRRQQPPDLH